MANKIIKSTRAIRGRIEMPGDKSISHRALLLTSIAQGTSEITGLSNAADVQNTLSCMQNLGVDIQIEKDKIVVNGVGKYGLKAPKANLDAGNSGTTIRLLAGILAAQNFTSTIDGDKSLRNRPMRRIIEPLENMGAHIESQMYKAPITIKGGTLRAIDYASPIASAQVKSCILFAGLYVKGMTRVTQPIQSRDHSERMLEVMGVSVRANNGISGVLGPADLTAANIDIPGDISAAAFFLVAGCLLPDSEVELVNLGINDTRTGILEALAHMGAFIEKKDIVTINNEPRASLLTKFVNLHATTLSGSIIPRIIDEIPILAVAATQATGTTVIRDAGELRVKESDRITTIVTNLRRMGANIRETKDGMVITGPTPLNGAEIESYGDHRIAMAFSIAGLVAEGETTIKKVDCVKTSFPDFYKILRKIRND
ncbi:3-phosphoshikimate 1-carboxyvinyltransferase [candidate division KSB1 bacterium]|nr:3-phosphoshikimate 1-carboxyvinyltransferase [candidate division KSB1 bacterium]